MHLAGKYRTMPRPKAAPEPGIAPGFDRDADFFSEKSLRLSPVLPIMTTVRQAENTFVVQCGKTPALRRRGLKLLRLL